MALFPVFYAGNLSYYRSLAAVDSVVFEQHEHFPKQTFRNRLEILGPNGLQKLVIPTIKTGLRRTTGDVLISYTENWQKDHWKSLEAAYRRSPYFEYYEDHFRPFFVTKTERLIDFNLAIHERISGLIGLNTTYTLSTEYVDSTIDNHRHSPFDESGEASYMQVFNDRHPFTPNLSILDALFNLGPRTSELLR